MIEKLSVEELKRRQANSSIINDAKFALTTVDNPYDPFIEFSDWLMFDNTHGYCSSQYLARIARTSNQFSDEENNEEVERAIEEILAHDFIGIYVKAVNPNYTKENI